MNKMKNYNHILEGESVYLRVIGMEDLEEYDKKMRNTSYETDYYTGYRFTYTRAALERYLNSIATDNTRTDFFIICKDSNEIIGEVSINDMDFTNRSSNIRIAIYDKKDFNKGYGSEGLLLAINYGFGMHNLHRIELDVYEFNHRAINVYEKIGFKREGVLRDKLYYNHKFHDVIVMSILKKDFEEKYELNEYI